MARPQKVSDEDLIKDVRVYLKECEENEQIPQVIRFARRHGYSKQALYLRMNKNPALLDSIKEIIDEKELVLEEGALTGRFNATMSIFSLKQLGWRDHREAEVSHEEEENTGVVLMPEIAGGTNE